MNRLYKSSVTSETICQELEPVIRQYALERLDGERFGDFCIRAGIVTPFEEGTNYHEPMVN